MKRRRISLCIAVFTIAVIGVAPAAGGQTSEQRAIRAASDRWQKAIAEDDVDAIVALHAPNAVLMFSNMPLASGSAAVRSLYNEMVKTPGLLMHWIPTRIEVTSPTTALEYGTYTESFDSPSGKMHDSGNYVVFWRKIDGRWRIALDAPSTTTPLPAAQPSQQSAMVARDDEALTWTAFSPPGFPSGGNISVLHGDPFSAGQFVLRLRLPDGYQIPLHWHPTAEYVTVISGGARFGMGNSVDIAAARAFTPGDFVFIPPRQAHFGQVVGETVLQITGNGPFLLNLGAPK